MSVEIPFPSSKWLTILVTAVITGVVTVGVGMALFYLQQREPRLEFDYAETLAFEGGAETLAIYHVTVANRGRASIDEVIANVSVAPGQIRQARVLSEVGITFEETASGGTYLVSFSFMNPDDVATISVLAAHPTSLPAEPSVSLRGTGTTGVRANSEDNSVLGVGSNMLPALGGAYMGLFAVFLMGRGSFSRLLSGRSQVADAIFVYSLHGLHSESERVATLASTTYQAEAERLGAIAAADYANPQADRALAALGDLLTFAKHMATSSQAVIQCQIARIAHSQGKPDVAAEAIGRARRLDKSLVEQRVRIDSALKAAVESAVPKGDRRPA